MTAANLASFWRAANIGSSNKHGFELVTPYYWNIAPQADATITPHYLRKRGLKLDLRVALAKSP